MHSLRAVSFTALLAATFFGLASTVGCAAGNETRIGTAGGGGDGGSAGAGGSGGSAGLGGSGGQGGDVDFGDAGSAEGEIYVHSLDKLYLFEPFKKVVTEIGTFDCVVSDPSGTADGGMHDIAVNKQGELYGVAKLGPQQPGGISSEHVILSIDKTTGKCQKLFALPNTLANPQGLLEVRGLSFVPEGTIKADVETLVGLEISGNYIAIDLAAKTAQLVGSLNGNGPQQWTTKGADIVSLILDKTYVTAKLQSPKDNLAVMDPKTGAITSNIGETPLTTIGGLAYWAGTLYGFAVEGGIYAVDPLTGTTTALTVTAPPGIQYHGAGVTTAAPIEPPK